MTDRAYSKARIRRIDTERVESELARNRVVVVAGFQGLNRMEDITTPVSYTHLCFSLRRWCCRS